MPRLAPAARRSILVAVAALLALLLAGPATAQETTLRLHHFLAESSPVHAGYLAPWAERVETESGGRIRIEIYPSMQLGGAPPSLIDQVEDGVVDLVWTLPGYTPGRFPITEVFELPFLAGSGATASVALCEFASEALQDEYADVRLIALHTSGPGLFHVRGDPIRSLEDLRGMQIRGPSRTTTDALAELGAEPIGMPVPQVPEALSRGVVDGALLPWEVTAPLRVPELVDSHTGFAGPRGFYVSTFLFAMNPGSYTALPDDLRAVIDANSMASGCDEARIAGANEDAYDLRGRDLAVAEGNEIVTIPEAEVPRWIDALQPVVDRWVADMDARGFDGAALLARARALIALAEAAD